MHCNSIPGICLWMLKWLKEAHWQTSLYNPYVCIYRHLFLFSGPMCGGGEVHCSKSFAGIPDICRLPQCYCVALRAMIMMIRMIPQTSPTIFRILAVLDASWATADSPAAFAFCALQEQMIAAIPRGRQQHKVLKIDHARYDGAPARLWPPSIVILCLTKKWMRVMLC